MVRVSTVIPSLVLVTVEISARISGELCSNSSRSIPSINQPEIPPLVSHVKTADWCGNTVSFSGSRIISRIVIHREIRKLFFVCQE